MTGLASSYLMLMALQLALVGCAVLIHEAGHFTFALIGGFQVRSASLGLFTLGFGYDRGCGIRWGFWCPQVNTTDIGAGERPRAYFLVIIGGGLFNAAIALFLAGVLVAQQTAFPDVADLARLSWLWIRQHPAPLAIVDALPQWWTTYALNLAVWNLLSVGNLVPFTFLGQSSDGAYALRHWRAFLSNSGFRRR